MVGHTNPDSLSAVAELLERGAEGEDEGQAEEFHYGLGSIHSGVEMKRDEQAADGWQWGLVY